MAKTKPQVPENVADLVAAMTHICLAQQDQGAVYQAHCIISNGTICATNGILSAGAVIRESIQATPHSLKFLTALRRAKEPVSITATVDRLTMVSGPLRAVLQCVDPLSVAPVDPDKPAIPVDNATLRSALGVVGPFASEGSETMLGASVISNNGSFVFCDGKIIIEAWHGVSMPDCIIPKVFVTAIDKIASPISHVGFGGRSITFYFENGYWLKSQLYDETPPDWQRVLNVSIMPEPVAFGLFDAIATVAAFSPDGFIHLRRDFVFSHFDPAIGARHEIPFLIANCTLNAGRMIKIAPYAKQIDFRSNERIVFFVGDKIRGALSKSVST